MIPGVLESGAVFGTAAVDWGCCGCGGGGAAGNGDEEFVGCGSPVGGSAVIGVEADLRRSWIFSLYASWRDEMEEWPSLSIVSMLDAQLHRNSA